MAVSPGSLKVLSFRGVELRFHYSLVLLLGWILISVAWQFDRIAQSMGIDPGLLPGSRWLWGLGISIGILVSIAIHEFSHALVAQSQGVKVQGITLMMLGGVSMMERIPEDRYAELRMALVGPLASLILGGALRLGAAQIKAVPAAFLLEWLGTTNIVLGVFNLLPAFPLDGGRALRSWLAARRGLLPATQTAVRVSQILAWVLGFLGLMSFNVILLLIALFIHAAAQSELFAVVSRRMLRGLKVSDVLTALEPVKATDPLHRVSARMSETGSLALPVELNGLSSRVDRSLTYMVTAQGIRKIPREFRHVTLVSDVMEAAGKGMRADESLPDALQAIERSPGGAVPVLGADGSILGLVRLSDIQEIVQLRSLDLAPEVDRAPTEEAPGSKPRSAA